MFFVMHLQQAGSQWNPISSKSISLLQAIKQTQIQTVNTNTYLHSGYNVPIYKNTVILPTQSISTSVTAQPWSQEMCYWKTLQQNMS